MILVAEPGDAPARSGKLWARAALLFSLLFFGGCEQKAAVYKLSGSTMGTFWHVTLRADEPVPAAAIGPLRDAIQGVLDRVDADMSTYKPESDLSRFNGSSPGERVVVSRSTLAVTEAALEMARQTGNAFNPAVAALVELWGFGARTADDELPSPEAIAGALGLAQLANLEIDHDRGALLKLAPLRLDYSAIAKGFAVDQVFDMLAARGWRHYLVEVGGELRAAGQSARGGPWRIGIEKPQLIQGEVMAAIALSEAAIASSGDYRNYREVGGVRYSHTLDPQTGYPVSHALASVTVVAPTAMMADAYATAINVMGPERGLAFAEERALPVYLVVKYKEGFASVHTETFERYLQ